MSNKKIVLVGYSGHGFVVADAAGEQGLNLQFYTEKQPLNRNPFSLDYLGFEGDETYNWEKELAYVLGVGDNKIRRKTGELVVQYKREIITVIHPAASVSTRSTVGMGVFISGNAAVNALAIIGNYCIVNTGAVVEHECRLETAVHIAPGAVLAGGVTVGENSFIGANSVIREGVKIGKDVIIGAGTVIIEDVRDGQTIVGNPGRKI